MRKISLSRTQGADAIKAARIRSIDLCVYRVEFDLHSGEDALLVDGDGKAIIFRALQQARDALAGLAGVPVELVHQSAYDEMVGQPERDSNRMAFPLAPVKVVLH